MKIVNLLGHTENESSKFSTRKWYVINDQNNTDYGEGNEDSTTVKFETKVIKSSLCDANPIVAFKNCAPFTKFIIHLNYEHVDGANNLDIIMPMYNLIECNDNYLDTLGRL